eukprot:TRINITY_DN1627_c0_g1_i4.p1 TRINITY_DN1627_c0_g1~~TRINITY_DN1627_c0_g1_i4.p1  ORF type:complete len:594 (+),score=95.73 TRINITY_DN1627_c0_g1_i4:106-1782(+)
MLRAAAAAALLAAAPSCVVATVPDPRCSTGSPVGDICCASSCAVCSNDVSCGGSDSCCHSKIRNSAVSCETAGPPCVISPSAAPTESPVTPPGPDPTCAGGVVDDVAGDICCLAACGTCGGSGCGLRTGRAADCCGSSIRASGRSCHTSGAPCVIPPETGAPSTAPTRATNAPTAAADPTCSGGIPAGDLCCLQACGTCGGSGCGTRTGIAAHCCGSDIRASGRLCHNTVAPCVMTSDPTCAGGVGGSPAGDICCLAACGTCGGSGCGLRTGRAADCCGSSIRASGRSCHTSVAPCVMTPETAAPTMYPTSYPTPFCCTRLLAGVLHVRHERVLPDGMSVLVWYTPVSSPSRAAVALDHSAEVDISFPPDSISAGGYLYNADYYLFGEDHCLGSGVNISITCTGTPHCAVYAFVYHQPPFSANTNGGFPQLADSAGWQARSRCAPRFGNDTGSCPMLGLRYNLMENQPVQIEQAAGTDLQYFLIAVVARKNCADNTLDDQAKCTEVPATNLSTTCVWNSGTNTCEDDWCPPRTPGPPSSGGGGGSPTQCPIDLDCSDA